MELEIFNDKIIIIKDEMKKSLLKILSGKLINTKIITLSEFKKKYFFDYDNKAIFYICKKYNVIPEIAKIYLNNLYYVNEQLNDKKVSFLYNLKNELKNEHLLYENEMFRDYIKNKNIIVFECEDIDKFYKNVFNDLNVTYYNLKKEISKKMLYSAVNKEEEISFVCSKICYLIKKGIDINKIKLCNVNSRYLFDIKRIFKIYNIPVETPSEEYINGTFIIKKFKELYSENINETLDKLNEYVFTDEDRRYYNKILNIVNSYNFCESYNEAKDLIFNDINNIKCLSNKLLNSIKIIDFKNDIISDDEYVFLINFNEGVIPSDYKDEDYLSDKIKKSLGISTSYDKNLSEREYLINKISTIKNLILTYSNYDGKEILYKSSLYDKNLFIEDNVKIGFNDSNLYNKLCLVKERDLNNKYGSVSEELIKLSNHYKDEGYLSYDNKFKGISKNLLYDYLNHKLTLSYTSVNCFYECGLKYYLNNILRLDKYEDTYDTSVGNIFHKILSECFTDNYDIDAAWNREISNSKYKFTNVDLFFLKGLKNELLLTIDTIKNQLAYSSLNKFMYEKHISIPINENLNIRFIGFVDKIMYKELEDKTIVVVIDYKTGNPLVDIKNLKYGLDMQLLSYVYLIKKSNEFKNVKIGGFYLQHILEDVLDKDKRIDSLKLNGYSNSDKNVLSFVDSNFEYSNVIKGMKVNNDGNFSYYSKVLSSDEIDKLVDVTNEKITKASEDIINGKFDINPKQIGNDLRGCKYCKYRSICYVKNEDIVVLGGEENELD